MSAIVVHVAPRSVLGVTVGEERIDLRPKERVVAAALTMHHPDPLTLNQLIDLVWTEQPPATAKQSIHNHLARLRTAAPGLVESSPAGYVLGSEVRIDVDGGADRELADVDYLIEFGDIPEVRRPRAEFVRRHRASPHPDPTDTVRAGTTPQLLARLDEAVRRDPGDERSWWLLAVATTQATGTTDGTAVIERARRSLGDVGLGLGRRLLDLDGMLRDGVDDVHVLLRDPFGSSGNAVIDPLDDEISMRLSGIRELWTEHEDFLICVRGPDDALRRAVLARIIDDARASGFSTAFARHLPGDIGPPTLRTAHRGARPVVMVVDGFDHHPDPTTLAARVVDRLPAPATGWVVAQSQLEDTESARRTAGLAETAATLVVETPEPATVAVEGGLRAPLESASASTRHLLQLLAAIGEPIRPEHLASVSPDIVAAALDAARAGFARVDAATQTIDLASNGLAAAALDQLDSHGRAQLATELLTLDLPALDEARRFELRARWSNEAYGADDDRTVAHAREAADAYGARGEYDVAAAVLKRVLDPIEDESGRGARWCRLGIDAGRFMLAGGDAAGDRLLESVVAAASALGDDSIAAHATHEWCRLGPASGAGTADDSRRAVTTELLDRLRDPGDRAKVGAAAAMVLSLSGEPDLLRTRFEDAVDDARSSEEPTTLAEVLPMAYMSVPLHSDIDERRAHADTLLGLSEQLGRVDSRWEALQLRYSSEVMRGDPAFRSTLEELDDAAAQLHEQSREWEMHFIRSNVAIIDGDLERARREADESLAFSGQVHPERVAAVFGAHHLVASMIDGTASDLLDALRTMSQDQPGIGAWHAAHAVAAASAGERQEAIRSLGRVIVDGDVDLIRDPIYSAGLVAIGEAAAATGERGALVAAAAALEPLAGQWSWCGSCTFGPIDLTRARIALALDDVTRAEQVAADAVVSCATMRAPVFTQQATDLLLTAAART